MTKVTTMRFDLIAGQHPLSRWRQPSPTGLQTNHTGDGLRQHPPASPGSCG
ncbi:hypothetical protein [Pseudomaricurvus sp. HS19]|uniref:hypothetical protein n=1 Tax=Pseudomaricurvus sp. HS19 TaxID=2692626 RepID=UPI00136A69F0|nr:hypothetical protein [Pseudomaricurvus sp. HS19]MYM64573.1 hypothetical protein [Pseudomaricurvus sp. HS19]